jgi:hypothetical protein
MKLVSLAVSVAILSFAGCEKPRLQPGSVTNQAASTFTGFASSDGTFLINQTSGKVWRFSSKDGAFLEVPVTSKMLYYNPATGKLEDSDPASKSGKKPCDKKTDPLCIL